MEWEKVGAESVSTNLAQKLRHELYSGLEKYYIKWQFGIQRLL